MRKRATEDKSVEEPMDERTKAFRDLNKALRKLKNEIKNWLVLIDDIISKSLMP